MNVDIIELCVEKCSEGKPLPSLPSREGLTNLLELLAAKRLMILKNMCRKV